MNENNRKFQDYVTSTAFHLNLSKKMVDMLAYVNDCESFWEKTENIKTDGERGLKIRDLVIYSSPPASVSSHIMSGHALERRGLIYAPLAEFGGMYRLTEAGKLVYELLKIAELIKPVDCPELEKK